MKPYLKGLFLLLVLPLLWSCGAAVVAGGATAGYKVATDPRSVGTQTDDATITARVKMALIKDPVTKARKIDVDTVNGIVTLTGMVETEAERKKAEEVAKRVNGVRGVRNNLMVGHRSFGRSLDDKLLTARIKTKLIAEPGIRSLSIDVDTVNGVVTLTGMVKSEEQRRRVLEIVRTTKGVKDVVDNLTIENEP
ncbi:BON domain-containing protein [Thermosulfurimonas dismutans]|uniref:Osmotically inducible protein Y n=1 Tax=Thermosulfurimonas dismutans TaxID=999894 RepID=A0A179D2W0_9BACT|nr:BON domain-containing protein [Thermosulfurimonas dismutans]OAQ20397.1 Osmotically inducible protein Y [Thermosulfurimonas dismutans]